MAQAGQDNLLGDGEAALPPYSAAAEESPEAVIEKRISKAISGMSQYLSNSNFGENMATGDVIRQISSLIDVGDKEKTATNAAKPSADPFSPNFDLVTYIRSKVSARASHGLDQPSIAITYEDLEIFGDKLARARIPSFGNVILPGFMKPGPKDENATEGFRKLISKTSGFFKPGEMTLVLGRPGAGCSTFLREVAGCSRGLSSVNGKVIYNQMSQQELREHYPSFVVYNPEDDFHYPTLTVRETLRFALECRIGAGSSVTGMTREEIIEERMQVVLKMLGLMNCADTYVGNELVRGCSGGERKRVSLAEMWCLGVSVGIWDGSTKGLDSSTALDFIRALRVMTDLSETSQVVSIYQASEEIYELFDNVILIADGHVIYFGPAKEAPREYFAKHAGLIPRNRSTTPDFLTGLMDKDERRVMEPEQYAALGLPFASPPLDASEMEQIYLKSQVSKDMANQLVELKQQQIAKKSADKFRATVVDMKKKESNISHTDSKTFNHLVKSPYFTSASQQFSSTCKREFILAKRDFATAAILVFDTFMAFIIGMIFFQLKLTPAGMVARGGVLFFALIYMCFNVLASVPLIIQGRAISGKHKTSMMYRTHLQVFATQITNAPAIFILAILYSALNYWLVGLRANGWAFITFILTTFLANQAFGSIVRLVGTVMPDLSSALAANSAFLMVCVISMGYIIPFASMKTWFKIFYWINPLQYALRTLFQNEFINMEIPCEDFSVPYPTKGDASANNELYASLGQQYKACLVTASGVGDEQVSGLEYIEKMYGFNKYNLYWNWLVLLGYIVIAYYAMMLVSKYFGARPAEYTVNVWKSESEHSKAKVALVTQKAASGDASGAGFKPVQTSFTWKHIDYTVVIPKTGEHRQLLRNVQGFVKSGEMVALMGSSGAGKTTLMDCVTQRKTEGDLKGQIYVRDQPQDVNFKSKTAYCEQMDVHNPFSTVRETVYFAARLRQSADTPLQQKEEYAEYILHLLELDPIANALVGRKGAREGISMEQQKRLTIACELASKPEILFLDEPTSGLDSQAAFTIVRLLRKLADLGQAVLCTIHQPSAVVFEHFDKVLLLARGGQTVYFGDLGHSSESMIKYFTSNGANPCPPEANPAEWMLEVIGAGIATNGENTKRTELGEVMDTQWWVKTWAATDNNAKIAQEIDALRAADDAKATPIMGVGQFTPSFACGPMEQFHVVFGRMLKTYWRNPLYNNGRVFTFIWGGLWVGFAFLNTPFTAQGINNKTFSLYQIMTIGSLLLNYAQPNFFELRNVFLRERSTGVYSWFFFAISIILAEIPFLLISGVIFTVCYYFPSGMNPSFGHVVYFWINWVLFSLGSTSLGMAIVSFFPSVGLASSMNPFFIAFQLLNCGITLPKTQLPRVFKWVYYINPFHYFAEAIMTSEVEGHQIICDTEFGSPFLPAPGQTCGEYMSDFFKATQNPGSLYDANATDICYYCNYASAETMMDDLYSWIPAHKQRNTWFLLGFFCFNCVVVIFSVWRYKAGR